VFTARYALSPHIKQITFRLERVKHYPHYGYAHAELKIRPRSEILVGEVT
jgi:hypothetical protein